MDHFLGEIPAKLPPPPAAGQGMHRNTEAVPSRNDFSSSPSDHRNDKNFQVTRHEIDIALGDIAEEDKRALLYALEHVPELVEIETHPTKFLLREDYNVHKAVKRMANHWKYRKELFGERAFRPMIISGDGALSPEDVECLKMGAIRILRGPLPTYYIDFRIVFELSPDMRKRLHFYCMHVLSEVRSRFLRINHGRIACRHLTLSVSASEYGSYLSRFQHYWYSQQVLRHSDARQH